MSKTIQQSFREALEQSVRDHLVGNSSGPQTTWHWTVKPAQEHRKIVKKWRLILSWVLGSRVVHMSSGEILYHIIEEYKKYDYDSYLTLKYGEYWC